MSKKQTKKKALRKLTVSDLKRVNGGVHGANCTTAPIEAARKQGQNVDER